MERERKGPCKWPRLSSGTFTRLRRVLARVTTILKGGDEGEEEREPCILPFLAMLTERGKDPRGYPGADECFRNAYRKKGGNAEHEFCR